MKWNLITRRTGPLGRWVQDFDSLLEGFFHDACLHDGFNGFEGYRDKSVSLTPSVDIQESEDRILLKAELPGMTEKDIRVEIQDRVLSIEGEKKEDSKSQDGKNYLLERRYGKFNRSFRLPEEIDIEKVQASYKNGVLSLELPKDKKQAPQKIQIDVSPN